MIFFSVYFNYKFAGKSTKYYGRKIFLFINFNFKLCLFSIIQKYIVLIKYHNFFLFFDKFILQHPRSDSIS